MQALRVAMVHGRGAPRHDGVADYTSHLAQALRGTPDRAPSDGGVAQSAVDIVDVAVSPGPLGLLSAARRIRRVAPDLVHVQFAPSAFGYSAWPGLLPDLVGERPVVTTLHEYGWWSWAPRVPDRIWQFLGRRRLLDRETGRLVPRSAAVVTTNEAHAGVVATRTGIGAHRAPLPPNVAVHPSPPDRGTVRRGLGIAAGARVVVFFGFVHPVKGLRYLVDAVAALGDEHPELHLVIAGGFTSLALPADEADAFRAELTGHVAAAGVTDRVTVTGHRPAEEVSAILAASDVAAFPFTGGATPKSGALLAALAHGLPTIVTRRADADDDVDLVDGRTVVVAREVRDVDVLVTALRRLLDDDALRRRVTEGGRALVRGRDWGSLAQRHLEIYRGVLEAWRGMRRAAPGGAFAPRPASGDAGRVSPKTARTTIR